MSRTVTGYTNGKPSWSENSPARARLSSSRGGLALGQALTAVSGSSDAASVQPVGAQAGGAAEVVEFRGERLLRGKGKR